jgi:hypothetical protein
MKNLKKDLRALSKKLEALVGKVDKVKKDIDKLEGGAVAGKGAGKTRATRKTNVRAKGRIKRKKGVAVTATDRVINMIKRSKQGLDVPTLIKRSGFEDRKVRNILARAFKQGRIARAGRGIYAAQKERRKHYRINSLNLVSYDCIDTNNEVVMQAMGRTLDVTEGGILLETHVPLKTRFIVSLTIGVEDDIVDVQGKVVHCRTNKGGRFKSGIQFTGMDRTSLRILRKFIAAFKKQQLGH